MAKDKKEYNREYYAAHKDIWERNYAENADARRTSARIYAGKRWENDPEYREAQKKRTIERSRISRQLQSLVATTEKIFGACQKFSENMVRA